MSIYASSWSVDADDHTDTCRQWERCFCVDSYGHSRARIGIGEHWRYVPQHPCTCGCGPIVYRGSHILPSAEDKRGGSLSLAEIPGFITRNGRDDGPEDEDRPWPYLRATMRAVNADDCQDVVLDRGQVSSLSAYLVDWLERTEDTVRGGDGGSNDGNLKEKQ